MFDFASISTSLALMVVLLISIWAVAVAQPNDGKTDLSRACIVTLPPV